MSKQNNPEQRRCAVPTGSGQLTSGARHYGFTTEGAASYIKSLLDSHAKASSPNGDAIENTLWEDLTGYDRACIAELLAHFRQNAAVSNAEPKS